MLCIQGNVAAKKKKNNNNKYNIRSHWLSVRSSLYRIESRQVIPNCCAVCLASSCVSISLRSNPVVGYKQLTAVCTVAVCLLTWGNCSHLLSNCLFRMRNACLRQSFSHPVSSRCQFFSHKRLLVLRPTYVPLQKRKKNVQYQRLLPLSVSTWVTACLCVKGFLV